MDTEQSLESLKTNRYLYNDTLYSYKIICYNRLFGEGAKSRVDLEFFFGLIKDDKTYGCLGSVTDNKTLRRGCLA